jgi:cell division protein FtsQ
MHKRFIALLIVAGLALAAVIFFFSPLFYITDVKISGNESVSSDEILERTGYKPGANLVLFNTGDARRRVLENLYIDTVQFTKTFPNQLTVIVRERHLSGYVKYMQDKYLYIDENGRVLDINSVITEKLPLVTGLKFDKVHIGELLEVENTDAFKTVVWYARLLNKYEITNRISSIDVSDESNVKLHLYNIEINIGAGGDKDADEKIRTVREITENLPNIESIAGELDLRVIRTQYVLKTFM